MSKLKDFNSTKLNENLSNWNDVDLEISIKLRGNGDEEMGFVVYTMSELKAFIEAAEKVNPWEDVDGVESLMGFDDLSTLIQQMSDVEMYSK